MLHWSRLGNVCWDEGTDAEINEQFLSTNFKPVLLGHKSDHLFEISELNPNTTTFILKINSQIYTAYMKLEYKKLG